MYTIDSHNILPLFLRVVLGTLFFFQGYDKVFKIGMRNVLETFKLEFAEVTVPKFLLGPIAYYSSFAELICGIFLIFGFCINYCLYALGFDLLMVVFGFSLIKPLWNMGQIVFPRVLILSILLYLPEKWDVLSVDYLIRFFR